MKQKLQKAQINRNSLSDGDLAVNNDPSKLCLIAALFVTVITLLIYKPTLFNFFITDEFIMISWLKTAVKNPLLICQEFYHLWMDHLYYRPVESVILTAQYFLWGANAPCFRLMSIFCMLLSSFIIGLIVFELSKKPKGKLVWAIASAALFAFYPLHGEPINWFVAQHDVSVTLFCLLSFWLYLRWRHLSKKIFLIASLCSMTLALLIKEMAVTLPFVLLSYEVICVEKFVLFDKKKFFFDFLALKNALIKIIPYGLLLAVYFCVRKIVLGTFIGHLSVTYYSGSSDMFRHWLYTVKQILIPIDSSVFNLSTLSVMWTLSLVLAFALSLYAFKRFNEKRLGVFLLLWFILSLAPAYKLLIIAPDLSGSRIAYLATVPLCMFLTYGFANLSVDSFDINCAKLARGVGVILCLYAICVLYNNNQAYSQDGHLSNRIVAQLRKYYESTNGDPKTRIFGLPSVTAASLSYMTKTPFLERDILNCDVINAGDQLIPFGILKDAVTRKEDKTNFVYWDSANEALKPVVPYSGPPPAIKTWRGSQLKSIVHVLTASPTNAIWEAGDALHVIGDKPVSLEIDLRGIPCWTTDFLSFNMQISPIRGKNPSNYAELFFLNDVVQHYSSAWNSYCRENVIASKDKQNVIFPLRSFPDWVMGGKCRGLRLLVPRHCDFRLVAISIPETRTLIPELKVSQLIHLSEAHNSDFVHYDASHVKGCSQVVLEVVGPDKDFETLYSDEPTKNALFNIPASNSSGVIEIPRSSFPYKGLYKARLRSLATNGQQLGLSSDHFLIDVKS